MSYLVHLQQFEGPLGLLLYLIRKEEMDIFDINVVEITRQYLDYIRMMRELDLEVAGDFVSLAATLLHIKSRMLLPQYDESGEIVEVEDPRKELVDMLLEYQRYQEASKKLYARPLLNRDVWVRGIREDFKQDGEGEIILEDEGLFSLIASYRKAIKKMKKAVHHVRAKAQSIASRVNEIKDLLPIGRQVVMRDLLNQTTSTQYRIQLLITFLSLLELGRMGFVSLFQSETYGDIYIEATRAIERNALERVQEFESDNAEAVANAIMTEAIEAQIDEMEAGTTAEHTSQDLGLVGEIEPRAASDEEIFQAEQELA